MKKYLLSALFTAALLIPLTTFAQTVPELQQQINALLAQIQALQAQLSGNPVQGGSPTQPAKWCYNFTSDLRVGSQGDAVSALQNALKLEGILSSDQNGTFGDGTASAVSGFQEKYGSDILNPVGLKYGTGYVGKGTRAVLNHLYGCPPTAGPITKPIDNPITSTSSNNLPPVINSVSAPTLLKVGEVGTWTVAASDPENGQLSYGVQWGDQSLNLRADVVSGGAPFSQTSTFTHSYAAPGIYSPTFVVTDSAGLSATTSTSVGVNASSSDFIRVISPNGGETFTQGGYMTITWITNGTPSVVGLNLEQNGAGFLGIGNVPNTGSYTWHIPTNVSGNFKILAYGNGMDDSDGTFSIVSATSTPGVTVVSPNGGEVLNIGDNYTFRWTAVGMPSNGVTGIALVDQNTGFNNYIIDETCGGAYSSGCLNINAQQYTWKVSLPPGSYKARIFCVQMNSERSCDPAAVSGDMSDAPFTIQSATTTATSSIKVTSPNGGETFTQGANNIITWQGASPSNVDILLTTPGGSVVGYIDSHAFMSGTRNLLYWDGNLLSSDGKFIGGADIKVSPGRYKILIVDTNGNRDTSDESFAIVAPVAQQGSVTVVSPNGGEVWPTGSQQTIYWSSTNIPQGSKVDVILKKVDGTELDFIFTQAGTNTGSQVITVPNVSAGQYKVYVRAVNGTTVWDDSSNAAFSITVPPAKNQLPIGYHDTLSEKVTEGWACDANSPASALSIVFYKDRPIGQGGTFVGSTVANLGREAAVGSNCGGNSNHGFSYPTPYQLKDGQPHTLYAYAVDHETGETVLLPGSPRSIKYPTISSTSTASL